MHIVLGFLLRQVAAQFTATPVGRAHREVLGLLALNGSGKLLFDLLQTEQTTLSLVQALLETYEIDPLTAQTDVEEFLTILRVNGVLVESSTGD